MEWKDIAKIEMILSIPILIFSTVIVSILGIIMILMFIFSIHHYLHYLILKKRFLTNEKFILAVTLFFEIVMILFIIASFASYLSL